MSSYISVLLQRSSGLGGWGFLLGQEPPSPGVIVTQVDTDCVASQVLEPGDKIIELEGIEASRLCLEDVNGILMGPSNRLSMVLLKRRPTADRERFNSFYSTKETRREEISRSEELRKKTTEDSNYNNVSSQTSRSQKTSEKNVEQEKNNKSEGVYKAKPFRRDTRDLMDLLTNKFSNESHDETYYKDEEHHSSSRNVKEETTSQSSTLKKEILEMDEKKKVSSTFWTDPPQDLRSAIQNSKFWKTPQSNFGSTSRIFNQLNDLHNQQKKMNPREEKRQFWESCNRGKSGTDSPGSRSDGILSERSEEYLRARSCEPEHLKGSKQFGLFEQYRNSSPSNPFFRPSPTNPFYEESKVSYGEGTVDGYSTSTEKYSCSSKEEVTKESVVEKVINKPEEKSVPKSKETSDFTANREFFERATSVPTTSCMKNAQDLVSERLSPATHSGLRKPSDFINQMKEENRRARTQRIGSVDYDARRMVREKSVPREIPTEDTPVAPAPVSSRGSSVEMDTPRRCFTETSYEKVTRVGTPYENVESAWRREYRVATPNGFYDNNFEQIFKEESFVEQGPETARITRMSRVGPDEAVEAAFRELTVREGLEQLNGNGNSSHYTRQSNQIQNNGNSNPAPPANGPPPPPPPPGPGNIPAVRIASEIGPRKSYEPPAAIQNAMMTKDKKPFTYTPGGLDLSEIRSPRMARRISRNAHTEDSCTPQSLQQQGPTSPPGGLPLPPAAVAAMQPQIAIPVFPPGGGAPISPPPPPPPPPTGPLPSATAPPAPPPPPPPAVSPNRPEFLADIASHPPLRHVGQAPKVPEQPPPEFLADIASHPPLRPVGQPPRSSYEPQPSQIQVQLKPVSPKGSVDLGDGQVPFVPRPQVEIPVQSSAPPSLETSPAVQKQMRTPPIQSVKPPATPPIQQVRAPPTPPIQQVRAPPTPPIQQVRAPTTPPIQQVRAPPTPPIQAVTPPVANQKQPSAPTTPTLNKSPAPWLTNKATTTKEVQPPWAVRQPSTESLPPTPPVQQPLQQPTQQPGHQPVTRVIPIQIEGREPATPPTPPTPKQQFSQPQQKKVQPPSPQYPAPQQQYHQPSPTFNQAQPQYTPPMPPQPQYVYPPQQYIPPNFPQYGQVPPQQPQQYMPPTQDPYGKTRIIPIQMEGRDDSAQPPVYHTQSSLPGNGQNRNQNGEADPRKFQTQTSWTGNPTQSRSFRVLQKITGSDDEPQAPLQQTPSGEVILVNRVYPQQERLDESEY